jgi:hypothetical protein
VTRKLTKTDSKGTLQLPAVIEFTIAATTVTVEALMAETVENATHAAEQMPLTPPALGFGEETVNQLSSMINEVVSVVESWQPLLDNVELFMNAMDKISEVWYWLSSLHLLNLSCFV